MFKKTIFYALVILATPAFIRGAAMPNETGWLQKYRAEQQEEWDATIRETGYGEFIQRSNKSTETICEPKDRWLMFKPYRSGALSHMIRELIATHKQQDEQLF